MRLSVEIVVPMQLLKQVRAKFPDLLDDYSRAIGNRLRRLLPSLIHDMLGPFQTGRLARSVRAYVSVEGIHITIGEGVTDERGHPYVKYVFEGAPRHVMDQIAKGRTWPMVWSHAKGSGVAMRVNHPGQKARKDILRAIKQLALQVAEEEAVIFGLLGAMP